MKIMVLKPRPSALRVEGHFQTTISSVTSFTTLTITLQREEHSAESSDKSRTSFEMAAVSSESIFY